MSNTRGRPNLTHYSLLFILTIYLALAVLFAVATPAWQNPDEPAHYNYVAHIAAGEGLPVLQVGDYDQDYLERLKEKKFPDELSVAPVRYEFHQPPLYYLLATPVFWLSDGSLLPLRLLSVLMGGFVVLLIFLSARTLFPTDPWISLGAAAFAGLLPMHVAMMSAVNNDGLAEALIAAAILALLRWLAKVFDDPQASRQGPGVPWRRQLILLGVLVGLGLVTKATTYILLPLVVLVVAGALLLEPGRTHPRSWVVAAEGVATATGPALLIGLPLWIRNMQIYGNFDFLGLRWHDQVVTGQPLTGDWIAAHGWMAYWQRAWHFTFSSFWGVFGWLGVFMDGRIYTTLLVLTGIAVVGLLIWVGRVASGRQPLSSFQRWGLAVLLLLGMAALASYVWYNLRFVQHQGRYLFSGLLSISLFAAIGWREALRGRTSVIIGLLLALATAVPLVSGFNTGSVNKWTVLILGMAGSAMLGLGILQLLEKRLIGSIQPFVRSLPVVLSLLLLMLWILLDAAIPFVYIIPQTGPSM